jgi:hypothetical protein
MADCHGQERGEHGDSERGPGMTSTKQSRQGRRYGHWPSLRLSWTG